MFGSQNVPTEEQAVHLLVRNGGRRVDDGKFQANTARYIGRNGPLRDVLLEFPDDKTAREAFSNLIERVNQKKWMPGFDRISPARIEFLGIAQSIGLEASLLDPGVMFGSNRLFFHDETSGENLGVLRISAVEDDRRDVDLLEELFTATTGHKLGYVLLRDDEL
ncbi:MAG: hypothetical protein ACO3XO_00545 [Bdellovibrionota bacterium]|jgi:hypothetical protein